MLTQGNSVVIGARWAAELLRSRSEVLALRAGGEPIPQEVAEQMTHSVIYQLMGLRRTWVPAHAINYNDIANYANVGWMKDRREIIIPELTGDDEPIAIADVFICNVLNQLVTEIEKYLLNPYFPERTWDYYTIGILTNGDVCIRHEGDYRVCRFEQLVREGKATY